jgi:transcriptional regulator with XRE-family HTH domain
MGGDQLPSEKLSKYFTGVAVKKLSQVEIDKTKSNQHEINGVTPLKSLLGRERRTFPARFIYLADDEKESITEDGSLTWYDARENHEKRSEYRLYYTKNSIMEAGASGDSFILGLQPDHSIIVVVAKEGSISEKQLLWLFGDLVKDEGFQINTDTEKVETGFAARYILEQMGIDTIGELSPFYLDDMLRRFNGSFPTTREFSAYARETVGLSSVTDPDRVLLQWLEREEELFRLLERHLVHEKLQKGFKDINDFVETALSVINRRKSRVGSGFENHVEQIFKDYNLSYSSQQITENKSKPDFIFPHIAAYHNLQDHVVKQIVTVLGVKYSCKDRWRQVLSEAQKLDDKYLLTVEAGISLNIRLKELRKEKGLTQSEVAGAMGLDRSTYGKYETGDSIPDLDKLSWLAAYFDVSTDYLLGRSNIKKPASEILSLNKVIADALTENPELLVFWNTLKEREDLQLLFKQTRKMSPKGIRQVIRMIKAIEEEEDRENE